jgi:hypothetical protein
VCTIIVGSALTTSFLNNYNNNMSWGVESMLIYSMLAKENAWSMRIHVTSLRICLSTNFPNVRFLSLHPPNAYDRSVLPRVAMRTILPCHFWIRRSGHGHAMSCDQPRHLTPLLEMRSRMIKKRIIDRISRWNKNQQSIPSSVILSAFRTNISTPNSASPPISHGDSKVLPLLPLCWA